MEINQLTKVVPTARQLAWQETEYYGFIHFGVNTMTDREWGLGDEPLSLFHPEKLDADLWVKTLAESQMQGVILTCKHHDGFCLWPTKTTEYSVKNTPWKEGTGDLVQEVSAACQKYGLKFGVYLSPWDRHEPSYGSGQAYNDLYAQQLTELLTNYGDIFSVWLDGANGEGPNGKQQNYDWEQINQLVRRYQPQAAISVCGPDVRWCGNEAGQTRAQEWSVVPAALQDLEKIAERSQQVDDGLFSRKVTSGDEDLGSREVLADYQGELVWFPAEVNTSIRPGWFYHASEDDQVRTVEELYQIYLNSVGGNATFLLNIPPNQAGEIHANDVGVLMALGEKIKAVKEEAVIRRGTLSDSSGQWSGSVADFLDDANQVWSHHTMQESPYIQVNWEEAQTLSRVTLQEDISQSQRIEAFSVYYYHNHQWKKWLTGGMVGYQRILEGEPITTTGVRVVFHAYREYPTLRKINLN
ncbi:alpha-L-fucosidase [Enterococcus sp. LJL98]